MWRRAHRALQQAQDDEEGNCPRTPGLAQRVLFCHAAYHCMAFIVAAKICARDEVHLYLLLIQAKARLSHDLMCHTGEDASCLVQHFLCGRCGYVA